MTTKIDEESPSQASAATVTEVPPFEPHFVPAPRLHQLRLARPIRSTQVTSRRETNTISTLPHVRQRTTAPRSVRYTASSATMATAPQLPQTPTAVVISAPNTEASSPPIA